MPSFERRAGAFARRAVLAAIGAAAGLAPLSSASLAAADEPRGFAVERLTPAPPGAGWFVVDSLDWPETLGGTFAMTGSYAANPLRITAGRDELAVVSEQAFVEFGASVSLGRFRAHLSLPNPLVGRGASGTVGGYTFVAPHLDPGSHPDLMSDPRLGGEARLWGRAGGPLRLGVGLEIVFPNGERADYVTDGTFRAVGKALWAGTIDHVVYAGYWGVHVRPRDDDSTLGSPVGSELLLGAAGGVRSAPFARGMTAMIGPEIHAETALRSLFDGERTSVEALLTTRLDAQWAAGPDLRVKVGAGAGLLPHFGAPDWRLVAAIEFSRWAAPAFARGE